MLLIAALGPIGTCSVGSESPPRSHQIDADGFGLPGLLIDTHFKADSLALADFIAVSQCRDVKENVIATVVWFDEPEPLVLVKHFNFASWHAVLKGFYVPCMDGARGASTTSILFAATHSSKLPPLNHQCDARTDDDDSECRAQASRRDAVDTGADDCRCFVH
jgi:hypothetical protein